MAKRKTKKSKSKKRSAKKSKGRHVPNWSRCAVCHFPVMGSRKGMETHMSKKHPEAAYSVF